jgi:alkylation response protein AidB-like acyl-CoA dehydrogenase
MQFQFSEDQLLLQKTVGDYLRGECTPELLRAQWETETGRSPGLWAQIAELGVPGLLVPEANDGLGMNELDLVLLLEETGRAGLAEPIVGTAAVAVPLLAGLDGSALASKWLSAICDAYGLGYLVGVLDGLDLVESAASGQRRRLGVLHAVVHHGWTVAALSQLDVLCTASD